LNVAAKVSKDDLDAIEYLQKHPEEFPYIVYDKGPDGQPVKLEEWQTECLKALRKKKRISIRAGHGVGKSAYLTFVIHWFMLTHYPCKVPCTANSQSQLFDVLWSELGVWHRCMKPEFKRLLIHKNDRIELSEDPANNFAVARTSRRENPEALQGFHSENVLFVIDEASGIDEKIFEVARGAMSTPGAITVMTGNPTRASGFFHNAFTKNRTRWFTKTVSCYDSTRVDPDYPKEIEEEYGKDSNVWRIRVAGLPPKEDSDAVIPRHLVDLAVGREVSQVGPEVWGVDVARMGNDRSALAKRRGNVLTEPIKWWREKDSIQLSALIREEYDAAATKPVEICIDVIGVGAGVVDICASTHNLPVRGVNVAERPAIHSDKYERLRDELWFKMKEWFGGYQCSLPKAQSEDVEKLMEVFMDEMTSPRFAFTPSGKLKVESKPQMKARGLKSPDLAEAFLMTFASHSTGERTNAWYSDAPIEVDHTGVF
jgi:phage terminase large subunit